MVLWAVVLKTTSSHEEGCIRRWSLASNRFIGKNGKVTGVEVEEVEWIPATGDGRPTMKPTGKKETIEADMVLLAMGFLRPEQPKFAGNVFILGMHRQAQALSYVPWQADVPQQQK